MLTVHKFRPLAVSVCLLSLATLSALAGITNTTLTVTVAGSPITSTTSGTVVTLTATVSGGGGATVKPGIVNFCNAAAAFCTDINIIGTSPLTGANSAIFRFVPAAGSHNYKAVFLGTNKNAASTSSTVTITVTQTGLILTKPSLDHRGTASGYTLTSKVGGIGTTPPTGTVSFLDTSQGNAVLAKSLLSGAASDLSFVRSSDVYSGVSFLPGFDGTHVIAQGDFNGDGFVDLALINAHHSRLLVALGNGDGTFQPSSIASPVSVTYGFVTTGDFNGDGHIDLAVSTPTGVAILLGNGDGTFNAVAANAVTMTSPTYIAVADFNGDGILDIAALNQYDPLVVIAQGNGDGTFTAVSSLSFTNPSAMAAADFNNDGKADLAVATIYGGPVAIMLGNGDGTFTEASGGITPCYTCNSIAVADFNGDGAPDIAVSDMSTGAMIELLGNGDGTFTSAGDPLPLREQDAFSVSVGDFNGDGTADLAVIEESDPPSEVFILLGKGDGTFSVPPLNPYLTGGNNVPAAIAIADFNGDGFTDFAVASMNHSTASVFLAATETAATTVTGIVVPASSGTDAVVAVYSGDSAYGSSSSVPVALAGRTASVSPTSLSFPATYVGDTAGYQTVTLTNTSDTPLNISSIAVTSSDFYSFGIREQTCGASLAAAATCTFRVAFRPTNTKPGNVMKATISVIDDAFSSPQQIAVTGTVHGVPGLALSPSSLTFPATYVGQTAGYQQVTLMNISGANLIIFSIAITNTTSFYSWGIRENICGYMAPGDTCNFSVAFRPTTTGPITADITLAYGSRGSPQKIALSGTGK